MRSLFYLLILATLSWGAPLRAIDIVVDNDEGAPAYTEEGDWSTSSSTGYNGGTYRYTLDDREFSRCTWSAEIPETGRYEVSTIFLRSGNRSTTVPFTVSHADGVTSLTVDQTGSGIGSAALGEYNFNAGKTTVTMDNSRGLGAFIADAILFRSATDDPPVLADIQLSPSNPQIQDTPIVTVSVIDDVGVDSVSVVYDVYPGEDSGEVSCFDDGLNGDGTAGDGIYGGSIPAFPDGSYVFWKVVAVDSMQQQVESSSYMYQIGQETPPEYRSVWVDSWNAGFLTPSQCEDLIDTCREHNLNTVMVEVRKIGDATYNSSIEPRATNIPDDDFDPLAYLIDYAHDTSDEKKYIHIHAWFVMHRITRGETLSPQHVLAQHPEYIMSTRDGNTSAGGTQYLDPGHPGTVDHNTAVIVDCLENYDIDGINYDYIRYPEYTGDWGYNATSIERFNAVYGKAGIPDAADPDWADWRRECVTLEVRKIYVKTAMVDPEVIITADTLNWAIYGWQDWESSPPYAQAYQDWKRWLEDGILDYNALMNYAPHDTQEDRYYGWTDFSLEHDEGRGSIIGIGSYLQDTLQDAVTQLQYARSKGADGLNIYDWGSEVNAMSGVSRSEFYDGIRDQVFPTWADPPPALWKTNPTTGIFEGNVTYNGTPLDHASVTVLGLEEESTVSDGSGWYGILDVPPGTQALRASFPGYGSVVVYASIPEAGDIVTVNIDLAQASAESSSWMIQ